MFEEELDEQALWFFAAEIMAEETDECVVVPCTECDCAGCDAARLALMPFLPVTWH